MLKSVLTILLCIAVLVGCGKKTVQHDLLPSGSSVLAFGDSVTFGYGVSKGQDYPSKLATISGWNITNAGVSGERAEQAKRRINSVLKQYQPKMVLIELGGNDFLGRRKPSAVKEDLRVIIKAVKASNAIPVLVAVPALSPVAIITGSPSDSSIYKELATEEEITLIHSVFSNILGDESLRADQVHPNAAGYQRLAEGIAQQLRDSGLL